MSTKISENKSLNFINFIYLALGGLFIFVVLYTTGLFIVSSIYTRPFHMSASSTIALFSAVFSFVIYAWITYLYASKKYNTIGRTLAACQKTSSDKDNISETLANAQVSFLSSISHDLRTPLTSLIGYLEIISDMIPEDHKAEKYIKLGLSKGFQLNDLINSSFEYFYLRDADCLNHALMRCNSIERLEAIIQERLDDLGLQGFQCHLDKLNDKYAIVFDIRLIERLLDNITTNIVRYACQSEVIHVQLYIAQHFLNIEITNGIRISQSLYSTNSTGIGLSNCKKIVEIHNGIFSTYTVKNLYTTSIKIPINNIM